jgi:hypothetical protein
MAGIRRLRGRDTHPGELSFAQYHLLSGLRKCDDTKDLATAAAVLDRLPALYDDLSTELLGTARSMPDLDGCLR